TDDRNAGCEGPAAAAQLRRRAGDALRRGGVGQGVHLTGLTDVPVLAELAGEVAARGPEGEDRGAGEEVIQRLLLDGVDAEAAGAAVGGEDDAVSLTGPDAA